MGHVVANTTCTTANINGARVRLQAGTVWQDDDPFVLFRPDLFTPLDDRRSKPVEQATKAPGEKRGPGRPRKQAD